MVSFFQDFEDQSDVRHLRAVDCFLPEVWLQSVCITKDDNSSEDTVPTTVGLTAMADEVNFEIHSLMKYELSRDVQMVKICLMTNTE